MKLWPWNVLARAESERQAAETVRESTRGILDKAKNLWEEASKDAEAVDGMLAAADYRIRRVEGESWPDYRLRLGKLLSDNRLAPVVLAILDRLDGKTRDAFKVWLVAPTVAEAEVFRQRASALADFRSELVAALYAASPAERRAEAHRRGQEHNRIYLDQKQAQEIASHRA